MSPTLTNAGSGKLSRMAKRRLFGDCSGACEVRETSEMANRRNEIIMTG